jgi:AmiR/NasT family two-component response regulator
MAPFPQTPDTPPSGYHLAIDPVEPVTLYDSAGTVLAIVKPSQSATIAAHIAKGEAGMLVAPLGQCEFCDRRRAYLAKAMRRSRKRRKEQKK